MKSSFETKTILSLSSIFAFRMLGIFMLIPVFTLYAHQLSGQTPILIGIAFGIYGLSQAFLQIPFGLLSDKIGRKPVITFGLILFGIGSVMGAYAHSIEMMICARFLQGCGAIGSSLIALMADLTLDENRTKAMATLGMMIGISFSVSIVIGPLIAKYYNLAGIFWLIAGLSILGLAMLHLVVPTPPKQVTHCDSLATPSLFKSVLNNTELLRLNFGIFAQHAIFTAIFYAIPLLLEHKIIHHSYFYLPILIGSFICMVPLIIIAEKKRKMKPIFLLAISLLVISLLLLIPLHNNLIMLAIILFIFFIGFNLLEATLPSLVSKIAPAGQKGTAMGVYSSSQFLGIFIGGASAGVLYQHFQIQGIFYAAMVLAIIWLILAKSMQKPPCLSSKIFSLQPSINTKEEIEQQILNFPGVNDVCFSAEEKAAYLKVDSTVFNEALFTKFIQQIK